MLSRAQSAAKTSGALRAIRAAAAAELGERLVVAAALPRVEPERRVDVAGELRGLVARGVLAEGAVGEAQGLGVARRGSSCRVFARSSVDIRMLPLASNSSKHTSTGRGEKPPAANQRGYPGLPLSG